MTDRREDLDEDFLIHSVRRAPLLQALNTGPHTASELVDSLDRSRSTVHRAITSLEERKLIEKSNGEYRLTRFGETVADETTGFTDRLSTANSLEPFLNTVDDTTIPIECFVDAEVTRPQSRLPHASIQRIIELIEQSDTLRLLSTVISPVYVNVSYREMLDGMEIEAIFEPETIEIMLEEYEEKAYETVSTGNFDVLIHNNIPFELFLFDERMGMAAHNEDGIAQVFVESDTDAALAWATDVYETHLAAAERLQLHND